MGGAAGKGRCSLLLTLKFFADSLTTFRDMQRIETEPGIGREQDDGLMTFRNMQRIETGGRRPLLAVIGLMTFRDVQRIEI